MIALRFTGLPQFALCLEGARMTPDGFDANGDLAIDSANDADTVTAIQVAFRELGYPVEITGLYDAATAASVQQFKVDEHLAVPPGLAQHDGVLGRGTSTRLNEIFLARDPEPDPDPDPDPDPPPDPDPTPDPAVNATVPATDWECVGVAQVGGAVVIAAGVYCFEFRSRAADVRGQYLFVGGGLGLGGSLGGGAAPGPGDFVSNHVPDLWTALECRQPFSADDLHLAYAALSTLGAAGAYGYFVTRITAGWANPLFAEQDVSGWGTGVGVVGAMMPGIWLRIGLTAYY